MEVWCEFNAGNSIGSSHVNFLNTLVKTSLKTEEKENGYLQLIRQRQKKGQLIKEFKLSPNGIPSLEWLMMRKKNTQEAPDFFEFILYSNEMIADPQKPLLYIGLNNADKNTQYSQWQLVEIWDRIVGSLRYKPNAF